jgi:hypothetical protein
MRRFFSFQSDSYAEFSRNVILSVWWYWPTLWLGVRPTRESRLYVMRIRTSLRDHRGKRFRGFPITWSTV